NCAGCRRMTYAYTSIEMGTDSFDQCLGRCAIDRADGAVADTLSFRKARAEGGYQSPSFCMMPQAFGKPADRSSAGFSGASATIRPATIVSLTSFEVSDADSVYPAAESGRDSPELKLEAPPPSLPGEGGLFLSDQSHSPCGGYIGDEDWSQ